MKRILLLSPLLFLIACCLPSLELRMSTGKTDIMLGLRTLVIGWSGIFAGITAWFANPVWLLGLVLSLRGKPLAGVIAGVVAVAIGLTTRSVVGQVLPADESNVNTMTVVRVLPGFYLWLTSLGSLAVISAIQRFAK